MDYVRLSTNLYIHHVRLSRNLYIVYVYLSTSKNLNNCFSYCLCVDDLVLTLWWRWKCQGMQLQATKWSVLQTYSCQWVGDCFELVHLQGLASNHVFFQTNLFCRSAAFSSSVYCRTSHLWDMVLLAFNSISRTFDIFTKSFHVNTGKLSSSW